MSRLRFVGLISVTALVLACGDDDSAATAGDSSGTTTAGTAGTGSAASISAATYNLGLALGFVELAEARAPQTLTATAAIAADIVCVQEVWEMDMWTQLVTEATATHPNVVRRPPEPDEPPDPNAMPSCSQAEIDPLRTCVEANCDGVPTDMLVGCATDNCNPEVSALTPECLGCVAANLGANFDTISLICTSQGGGAYAYGGSFGTGILTDLPLIESDSLLLTSSLNRRSVLYAKVGHPDFGEVNVFCTHLSAVFESIPFPGEGTWEEEQAAQITRMGEYIQEKAADGPVILLGDMNTGPAVGMLAAEVQANYDQLIGLGFDNAYVASPDPLCTFCADNPLVGNSDDSTSVLIDHVLTRGLPAGGMSQRLLDTPIQVTDPMGATVDTAYSDHYGVLLTIEQ